MSKDLPKQALYKPPTTEELPKNAAEFKKGLAKWLPLIVLSTAVMIIIIDTTVLNVSLRNIILDLHTTIQGIQWVITGYALTLAALTITGGRLGDLFGRKRMFMLGAVIFACGSFITSISHSVGVMLSGEAIIEGIGAALMLPATASLIVANYQGRDRGIAFGVWGGIAGAASAIGPILGGYLTTHFSWRWAFRINIVVAAVLLLGSMALSESRDKAEKKELDWVGVLLSSLGLLSFVYGVIESSTYGWWRTAVPFAIFKRPFVAFHNLAITPFALLVGVLVLILFGFWESHVERKGHTPLVSLKLLRNTQFTSGAGTVALMSLGLTGLIFILPVYLQSVQNLDAFHTGLALLPVSFAVLIAAPGSAALHKLITPKRLIQLGLFMTVIASIWVRYLITATSSVLHLAPGLALFGFGMGLVFAQATNLTMSAVSVEESGEASGVNNTLRQVGTSFGSAIIGAVILATLSTSLARGVNTSFVIPGDLKPQLSASVAHQASYVELGGVKSDPATHGLSNPIEQNLTYIAHQASTESARKGMIYTGIFMFLAFIVSFALPNTHDLEERHRAPATEKAAAH